MRYIYRFNEHNELWEIVEITHDLDVVRVIRRCKSEIDAKKWIKCYSMTMEDLDVLVIE